jgi:hypothetical protein
MKQTVLFLFLIVAATMYAQMPKTLNYQGTLATGSTAVPDGNYSVTFRLYTASSGGSAVWTEAQLISTRNGVFNALLGKITPLPGSFNTSYWMSLQVGADPELAPRLEMTAVSYSMQSAISDSTRNVADGSITAAHLADGSVTVNKIVPNFVASIDGVVNKGGNVDLVAGAGISISPDDVNNRVTIGSTTAGLVPIAFAFISASGTKASGTSNVTSSWDAGNTRYTISISGESYYFANYVTVVTPITDVKCMTNSAGNQLLIYMRNASGTAVQSDFQFVTFKP